MKNGELDGKANKKPTTWGWFEAAIYDDDLGWFIDVYCLVYMGLPHYI